MPAAAQPAPGTAGIDSQGRAITHPPGPPGKSQALSPESAWLFYADSRAALPCNLKLNHDSTEKRPVRESSHHPWHCHDCRQGAGDHRNHQGLVVDRAAGRHGREAVQDPPGSVHAGLIPAPSARDNPGQNRALVKADALFWRTIYYGMSYISKVKEFLIILRVTGWALLLR